MRPFATSLLEVTAGAPKAFAPASFEGRINEQTLEDWIVERPDLLGERMLVLGRQLAEFAEDQDRLDVLAVDQDGEIVLIELKVSENFRVTDLQALAYAGAYASRDPLDLARTLGQYLQKPGHESREVNGGQANSSSGSASPETSASDTPTSPGEATTSRSATDDVVEVGKERIVEFLEINDFDEWQPSQHIRIKLVAPTFPQRVLKTVKWLGDVYDMPIEAIAVRLFSPGEGRYGLTFDRLLPLPGEEAFDMTIRRREERKRSENTTKRPDIVPFLLKAGALHDGQRLWVREETLRPQDRPQYDPDAVVFQVTVHAPGDGPAKFGWRASADAEPELLRPSSVPCKVYEAATDWEGEKFNVGVGRNFAVEPGGKTLEELALAVGWGETVRS